MTLEILGKREDQRLEFKSSDTLNDPITIAREVVGMLNADGGEVWIGVEEKDGVAAAVKGIPDPERAKQRLLDFLLDTLDPSPSPEEVAIETMPPDTEPALLVVKVKPRTKGSERAPYAFRKRGGWHFVRRVGARNHPMTRQEVFGPTLTKGNDEEVERAKEKLVKARETVRREPGLWLGLQPARKLDLQLQERYRQVEQIVLDPAATGNREAGWHFARSASQPKLTKDGIEWGRHGEFWNSTRARMEVGEDYRVRVADDGTMLFRVALHRLHHKGDENEIWPLVLLEFPISAFRIAHVFYQGYLAPDDQVAADLALLGIGGWGLRGGTPGDFPGSKRPVPEEESDLIWEPLVFSFQEIDETPDRCGFRLVRRVYQAFGFRETDMPRQYDQEAGKLILPE